MEAITRHPLYHSWAHQVRVQAGRVDEWNDFAAFTACVGEKPSPQHKLRRQDITMPWGPDNYFWATKVASTECKKAYARAWRRKNPLRAKDASLKKSYGISYDQYAAMYSLQDGKCAICGAHGEFFDSKNGRTKTLVVDHCHVSGAVRALLCPSCNKGLGSFGDSVETLQNAAAYIERHQA